MLKKITLLLLLTSLIIFASIQFNYLKTTTEELTELTENIEKPALQGDFKTAYDNSIKYIEYWKEKRDTFEMFCEHEEVDKIQVAGEKVVGLSFNSNGNLFAQINVLKYYLRHIVRIDSFSWENIF